MPDFLLVRHAPTPWNEARRLQGRADIALSASGRAQAARWRLPAFAAGWPAIVSPLRRAGETASAMGLAWRSDPAFVEMDWGVFEGRTLAELRAAGGEAFARNEARGLDFRPDGGETPREVGARALAGLAGLGTDAAIVSHKGVVRALLAIACGWDMTGRAPVRLQAASAQHFRLDGGLVLVQANISLDGGDHP